LGRGRVVAAVFVTAAGFFFFVWDDAVMVTKTSDKKSRYLILI
jgi:hypothetical protein